MKKSPIQQLTQAIIAMAEVVEQQDDEMQGTMQALMYANGRVTELEGLPDDVRNAEQAHEGMRASRDQFKRRFEETHAELEGIKKSADATANDRNGWQLKAIDTQRELQSAQDTIKQHQFDLADALRKLHEATARTVELDLQLGRAQTRNGVLEQTLGVRGIQFPPIVMAQEQASGQWMVTASAKQEGHWIVGFVKEQGGTEIWESSPGEVGYFTSRDEAKEKANELNLKGFKTKEEAFDIPF